MLQKGSRRHLPFVTTPGTAGTPPDIKDILQPAGPVLLGYTP